MWAAQEGYADVFEYLLTVGADVSAKDDDGMTPHDLAVECGEDDAAFLLRPRKDGIIARGLELWSRPTGGPSSPAGPAEVAGFFFRCACTMRGEGLASREAVCGIRAGTIGSRRTDPHAAQFLGGVLRCVGGRRCRGRLVGSGCLVRGRARGIWRRGRWLSGQWLGRAEQRPLERAARRAQQTP
jgi:hypothetical protein